jgi:hypothetical protein
MRFGNEFVLPGFVRDHRPQIRNAVIEILEEGHAPGHHWAIPPASQTNSISALSMVWTIDRML